MFFKRRTESIHYDKIIKVIIYNCVGLMANTLFSYFNFCFVFYGRMCLRNTRTCIKIGAGVHIIYAYVDHGGYVYRVFHIYLTK